MDSAVSGWDKAAAIGTITAAVATALAVIAALIIATQDRRAANDNAKKQRKAAQANLVHQIDASRQQATREHQVDLLLRLAEQLAAMQSPEYRDQDKLKGMIRALMYAIPDSSDELLAVRLKYLPEHPLSEHNRVTLRRRHAPRPDDQLDGFDVQQQEIAALIMKRMHPG